MSDRELLEMAAKAAGNNRRYYKCSLTHEEGMINDDPDGGMWNPLTDDGDALRLAVTCKIDVLQYAAQGVVAAASDTDSWEVMELHRDDPLAATRRAIVRAAAEIGRAMP